MPYYIRDPQRGLNFDNYPYVFDGWSLGHLGVVAQKPSIKEFTLDLIRDPLKSSLGGLSCEV